MGVACSYSSAPAFVHGQNFMLERKMASPMHRCKSLPLFFSLSQVDKKHKKKSSNRGFAATGLQRKQVFRAIVPTHDSKKLT